MINPFKWLKNRIVKPIPKASSIAPLYSASTNQIKELNKYINELHDRIDNINTGGTPPDLSLYARKDQTNQFTEIQDIKTTAPYLAFRKQNNDRKGYIGVPSSTSNDIELKAESNSLNLYANHNITLNAGNGYNIMINKTPSANNHIANKEYVDRQIANLPNGDLSNVPKLNADNHFTGSNTFGSLTINGHVNMAPQYTLPESPNQLVTKEYVDKVIPTPKIVSSWTEDTGAIRMDYASINTTYETSNSFIVMVPKRHTGLHTIRVKFPKNIVDMWKPNNPNISHGFILQGRIKNKDFIKLNFETIIYIALDNLQLEGNEYVYTNTISFNNMPAFFYQQALTLEEFYFRLIQDDI